MATRISWMTKNNLFLLRKSFSKPITLNVKRFLYSSTSLGLDGYMNTRGFVKNQFLTVDTKFREKMLEIVNGDNDKIIFTEDLKNMVHIIEKKPNDLELMIKMISKYHTDTTMRASNFVFGPVVMRALHYLDEPDIAFNMIKDTKLLGFFDQITSYQLIMDLLYEHGRYDDVSELYRELNEKNIGGVLYPRNPFIIMLAACLKKNTPESYETARKHIKSFQSSSNGLPRRAIQFGSYLALKQNDPNTALELLTVSRTKNYIDIRCLLLECYIALKRFDKIILLLQSASHNDSSFKLCFFKDSIERLEQLLENENVDKNRILFDLIKKLKESNLIQNVFLEDHICKEINAMKKTSYTYRKTYRENKVQSAWN